MQPVQPIQSVHLFPALSAELITLLGALPLANWNCPTACAGWTVKDVAAHLLGGNLGRLAAQREQFSAPDSIEQELEMIYARWEQLPRPIAPFDSFGELLNWINLHNTTWVEAGAHIPTRKLVELLAVTDMQLYEHFLSLPPLGSTSTGVLWAGETRSLNWFDTAREYTEKWLHQQHIRQAVGQRLLTGGEWLHPVLDTFLRALPHTYRGQPAPIGAKIGIVITGEGGGAWTLRREEDGWALLEGTAADATAAAICLSADTAWRLFTKGISVEAARPTTQMEGDPALCETILHTVAIMA